MTTRTCAPHRYYTEPETRPKVPACPVSEVNLPYLMFPSVPTQQTRGELSGLVVEFAVETVGFTGRYPEFCEDVVQRSNNQRAYDECRALTGYVVTTSSHDGDSYCRALTPIACPTFEVTDGGATFTIATNRTGAQTCGAVRRRSWECPGAYMPANTFNGCYLLASAPPGGHPCAQGAPEFPLEPQFPCEEYVGDDFLHVPTDRLCSQAFFITFDPGGNAHWCRYDPSLLRVECHGVNRPSDCSGQQQAFCIKRASRTGGCDQIAQTILCRFLQSTFLQNTSGTAEEQFRQAVEGLRRASESLHIPFAVCNPCQQLPFTEPADPRCASTASSRPRSSSGVLERVLAVKRDFPAQYYISESVNCLRVTTTAEYENNAACQMRPVCADPPTGRVTWTSTHSSGLAIINNAVTARLIEIPFEPRNDPTISLTGSSPSAVLLRGQLHFTGVNPADPADPPALTRATTLLLDANTTFDDSGRILQGSECRVRELPYFDLIVEELWPDHAASRDEIIALFGADSLKGWDALNSVDQRALTEARGLVWLGGSPAPTQIAARSEALSERIECTRTAANSWECDWTPTRSGYFKLVAAGAWHMTRSNIRNWQGAFHLGSTINENLESDAFAQATKMRLNDLGLTPSEAGLKTDSTGRIVGVRGFPDERCGEDRDFATNVHCKDLGLQLELFEAANAATASCAPIDVRVNCGPSGSNYNYTETQPVGVIVHELRVNTVMVSK